MLNSARLMGAVLGSLSASVQASAEVLSMETPVRVTQVVGAPLGVSAQPGEIGRLVLHYEVETLDTDPGPDRGIFQQSLPVGLRLELDGGSVHSNNYPVILERDHDPDEVTLIFGTGDLFVDGAPVEPGGQLFAFARDEPPIMLNDVNHLPNPAPQFSAFDGGNGLLVNDEARISFALIPEPSAGALVTTAVGLLLCFGRGRGAGFRG